MTVEIRPLTPEDEAIAWYMLVHAAQEGSLSVVQAQPNLARYVAGWGRGGDMGYVACQDHEPIGAVWLRLWLGKDKGFGYVDDSIPELAIAVLPAYRNRGIGTQLLNQLLADAQDHFPAVSLSVRSENPAVGLYERIGFVRVKDCDQPNRVGGNSWTMIYRCLH